MIVPLYSFYWCKYYLKPCQIKQLDPCHPENQMNLPRLCTEESEQAYKSLKRTFKDTKHSSLKNMFS